MNKLGLRLYSLRFDKHVKAALIVSVCVGTVLNLVNCLDEVLTEEIAPKTIFKIVLTYITPFCTSLYSSKRATKN